MCCPRPSPAPKPVCEFVGYKCIGARICPQIGILECKMIYIQYSTCNIKGILGYETIQSNDNTISADTSCNVFKYDAGI